MSGYIGTQPVPQTTQTRDSFTATSNQTSFPTSGYTPNYLDVFLNGVKLAAADYTATNNSDVVLAVGAATGDILEVVAYSTFNAANVTGAVDFTVTGDITVNGTVDGVDIAARDAILTSTTTTAGAALPKAGGALTGEVTTTNAFKAHSSSSGDYVRMYGGTGTGKWDIYGNGANLRIGDNESAGSVQFDTNVGIGTAAPLSKLDVSNSFITVSKGSATTGRMGASDYIVGGTDNDFVIQSSGTAVTRFVQSSTEAMRITAAGIGIGGTPDSGRKLHIEGGDATVGITLKDTAGSQFGINSDGGSLNFKSDSAGAVRMSISSTGVISGDGSGLTGISADISGGVASAGILINSTGSNFPIGCLILGSNTDSYINQAQAKNQKYGIQHSHLFHFLMDGGLMLNRLWLKVCYSGV